MMGFDDPFTNRQSQAGAFLRMGSRRIRAIEAIENCGFVLQWICRCLGRRSDSRAIRVLIGRGSNLPRPPGGEYLIALSNRFSDSSRKRMSSPRDGRWLEQPDDDVDRLFVSQHVRLPLQIVQKVIQSNRSRLHLYFARDRHVKEATTRRQCGSSDRFLQDRFPGPLDNRRRHAGDEAPVQPRPSAPSTASAIHGRHRW